MNNKQQLPDVTNDSPENSPSPWVMARNDSITLIKIARDSQQTEMIRLTALEILGRRADGTMEGKLARLSKKADNSAIKNAAACALHRSRYIRSSHVAKRLGGLI